MKIETYIKKYYVKLPKSTFNNDELVIVEELNNSNEGYGHHSYYGIGIDKNGEVYSCDSSGCSCSGTCGISKGNLKDLTKTKLNWKDIDFPMLQVDFRDY
jgi:hypothetical protein